MSEGNDRQEGAVTVADVGEFGLIARIVAAAGAPPPPAGPGDDAAVVPAPDGRLVATTDVLVEQVHFRLDWSSPIDIGHKAAAANLADVAAMGAVPRALLVALVVPAGTPAALTEELAAGLAAECAPVGAALVGGDVSSGPLLVVAVTALGDLQGRAPVTRAGARVGDLLVLAGQTGRSAAGLRLLRDGVRDGGLVAAHRRPAPPYALGPVLADAGASAMCDVSDGLLADAGHLARASGVRLEIDALPLPAGVRPLEALTGGEDHALLATVPAQFAGGLPAGVTRIGRVVAGAGVALTGGLAPLADAAGSAGGYAHFG